MPRPWSLPHVNLVHQRLGVISVNGFMDSFHTISVCRVDGISTAGANWYRP